MVEVVEVGEVVEVVEVINNADDKLYCDGRR